MVIVRYDTIDVDLRAALCHALLQQYGLEPVGPEQGYSNAVVYAHTDLAKAYQSSVNHFRGANFEEQCSKDKACYKASLKKGLRDYRGKSSCGL